MLPRAASLTSVFALLLAGCADPPAAADASVVDAPTRDLALPDAREKDAAVDDDVPVDAAARDVAFNDVVLGEFPSVTCEHYDRQEDAGALSTPEINETSGLVESRTRPGVFYLHNDSGDTARFFAISLSGALVAEYRLPGATAVDFEDITTGPCGATTCVYLGDIGDNPGLRSNVTVYRVEEPTPPEAPPSSVTPVDLAWTSVTFRYPDRGHDAETLLTDPSTGELYLITKVVRGPVTVYRVPTVDGGVAQPVTEMTMPEGAGQLTGGDVRPDGRAMLLRTYARVLVYERGPTAPFTDLFLSAPRAVDSVIEPQGESVAWRLDGRGYVTISEGRSVRINSFQCAAP